MASRIKVDHLIGTPFVDRGRSLDGCDCWGLLRIVFAEHGVDLPSYDEGYDSIRDRHRIMVLAANRDRWRPVPAGTEQALDGVLMFSPGRPFHVGVVVMPGRLLHTEEHANAHLAKYRSPAFRYVISGFFRYE